MTPLAQTLLRFGDKSQKTETEKALLGVFPSVKCFECSDVVLAAHEMTSQFVSKGVFRDRCFLPHHRTWLEFKMPSGKREGMLLSRDEGKVQVIWVRGGVGAVSTPVHAGWFLLPEHPDYRADNCMVVFAGEPLFDAHSFSNFDVFRNKLTLCYSLLCFINSPAAIRQVEHPPHKGLQREINRSRTPFVLRPWTEIKLEVSAPRSASNPGTGDETLRGERALHYCRAHLRIQNGRLVRVTGHWRGDAANGIVRSDYRVVA